MNSQRIALIGLRGSGKSSVGEALARQLDLHFMDSDTLLQQAHGCSPGHLLNKLGEAEFRRLEIAVVKSAAAQLSGVLALGGGVPTQPENHAVLQGWTVIWLDAPDPVLVDRIQQDRRLEPESRPPLTPKNDLEEMAEIRRLRCEDYERLASLCVECSIGTPDQIAIEIVNRLEGS